LGLSYWARCRRSSAVPFLIPLSSCLEADRTKINVEKYVFTFFCYTSGVLFEQWLPPHVLFNSMYFCVVGIPGMTNVICPNQTGRGKRGIYFHMDNARRHNSKGLCNVSNLQVQRIPRPQHSPFISLSSLYLFGSMKQRLQACEGRSFVELRGNVSEFLNPIASDELR
jgi:hypothetical protein